MTLSLMKKDSDSPPSYSEPLLPQFPAPRPITSGPVLYPGNALLELIVWFYIIAGGATKLVMAFGFKQANCHSNGFSDLIKEFHFCFFIFSLNFVNAFNCWPYFCMIRDLEVMQRLRSPGSGITLGLFDCIISTLVVLTSLAITDKFKYTYEFLIIPGIFLTISACIVMYIVSKHSIKRYTPYDLKNEYVLAERSEIHLTPGIRLTVRESGPFRIILENIGETSVGGFMNVERIVMTSYKLRREKKYRTYALGFIVDLPKQIDPGEVVTLIPATHREIGAHRVDGIRAFGRDKGDVIYTSFCNGDGRCLVRLTEKFKKDKFMANQVALQSMDDAMRMQIY